MNGTSTKEQAKIKLVEKIEGLQGIKATELVSLPDVCLANWSQGFDIPDLLDELVSENRIVEIEYALPEMSRRIKSFYLPAKTEIFLNFPHNKDR